MATMTKTRKPVKSAPVVSLALSIDHQVYSVEPIQSAKGFRLTKQAARDDVYDVVRTSEGLVTCSCPSYQNTFADTVSTCKHGDALLKMGLLEPIYWTGGQPTPKADKPEPAEAPAPCCSPTESAPCAACVTEVATVETDWADFNPELFRQGFEHWSRRLTADAPDSPAVEPDPLAELPFPRVERTPFVKPFLAPLPRPLPPEGQYRLADLATAQADAYAALGNAVGTLFADTMRTLAGQIRATGAVSVEQFEGRIAEMEHDRDERIRSEGFDQGYMVGTGER